MSVAEAFRPGDEVVCASSWTQQFECGLRVKGVELVTPIKEYDANNFEWWAWDDQNKLMCRVAVGKLWIHRPK